MAKCPSCGTDVTDASRLCSQCGAAVASETFATRTAA